MRLSNVFDFWVADIASLNLQGFLGFFLPLTLIWSRENQSWLKWKRHNNPGWVQWIWINDQTNLTRTEEKKQFCNDAQNHSSKKVTVLHWSWRINKIFAFQRLKNWCLLATSFLQPSETGANQLPELIEWSQPLHLEWPDQRTQRECCSRSSWSW